MKNLQKIVKEAEHVLARNREQLEESDLLDLKNRVQAGMHRLRGTYDEVGDRLKGCVAEVEDRIGDCYNDVEERLRNRVEMTDDAIRTHPYRTVGIAFIAGLAVGAILRGQR